MRETPWPSDQLFYGNTNRAKHWTLRTAVEKDWLFVMNGTIQENGKLMLKGVDSFMACRLQTIYANSKAPWVRG